MSMSDRADDIRILTQKAQAVKRKYEAELLSRPNVTGVGIGYVRRQGKATGEIGIVVMVEQKVASSQLEPHQLIPTQLEGVTVDVQEVGTISAQ